MRMSITTYNRIKARHDTNEQYQKPQRDTLSHQPAHLLLVSPSPLPQLFRPTKTNPTIKAIVAQATQLDLAHQRVRIHMKANTRHATLEAFVSNPCERVNITMGLSPDFFNILTHATRQAPMNAEPRYPAGSVIFKQLAKSLLPPKLNKMIPLGYRPSSVSIPLLGDQV